MYKEKLLFSIATNSGKYFVNIDDYEKTITNYNSFIKNKEWNKKYSNCIALINNNEHKYITKETFINKCKPIKRYICYEECLGIKFITNNFSDIQQEIENNPEENIRFETIYMSDYVFENLKEFGGF